MKIHSFFVCDVLQISIYTLNHCIYECVYVFSLCIPKWRPRLWQNIARWFQSTLGWKFIRLIALKMYFRYYNFPWILTLIIRLISVNQFNFGIFRVSCAIFISTNLIPWIPNGTWRLYFGAMIYSFLLIIWKSLKCLFK